ncbi:MULTISPECIES: hypothetical protein [Paenibacillus]|uniref:hypothetical protein n=1 Tax=Paenibacillus TaxID=44249 RepID=UPI00020D72C0|nr:MULTISPECIES: hypothetical protein [Paenibacillus]EGL16364.1 hypothetical protein HMPREF9413_2206 [Paenibacillus sp. HGF7]EPD88901.1 hypothetical protein HMPREF1207_01852 [Paenibacillus sp. HGH0039]MBV6717321.1 hypothetical protein [Paenibacillus chitinolyticus]
MGKISFRELFSREAAEDEFLPRHLRGKPAPPQRLGDPFVHEELPLDLMTVPDAMVGFISLTCKSCIELLPEVKDFTEAYTGTFILASSGSAEENRMMADSLEFMFPVLTVSDDVKNQYGIKSTPYALRLQYGIISGGFPIHSMQDLHDALRPEE